MTALHRDDRLAAVAGPRRQALRLLLPDTGGHEPHPMLARARMRVSAPAGLLHLLIAISSGPWSPGSSAAIVARDRLTTWQDAIVACSIALTGQLLNHASLIRSLHRHLSGA
jgi:hypothetical protein